VMPSSGALVPSGGNPSLDVLGTQSRYRTDFEELQVRHEAPRSPLTLHLVLSHCP